MTNLPANYDAMLAADAARMAGQEKVKSAAQGISLRGGILKLGDYVLPGNQMAAVIVDAVFENTWFATRFDPNVIAPPNCYALGRADNEMAPAMPDHKHFTPQSQSCTGCPQAEWGSSDTGRGKACSNKRRLGLLAAGIYTQQKGSREWDLDLFDGQEHYAGADLMVLRLPVTSVRNFSEYVQSLAASHQRAPYAAFTRIYAEPDTRSQFQVHFELIEMVPNHLLMTLRERSMKADTELMRGYEPPEEQPEQPAPAKGFQRARTR